MSAWTDAPKQYVRGLSVHTIVCLRFHEDTGWIQKESRQNAHVRSCMVGEQYNTRTRHGMVRAYKQLRMHIHTTRLFPSRTYVRNVG